MAAIWVTIVCLLLFLCIHQWASLPITLSPNYYCSFFGSLLVDIFHCLISIISVYILYISIYTLWSFLLAQKIVLFYSSWGKYGKLNVGCGCVDLFNNSHVHMSFLYGQCGSQILPEIWLIGSGYIYSYDSREFK